MGLFRLRNSTRPVLVLERAKVVPNYLHTIPLFKYQKCRTVNWPASMPLSSSLMMTLLSQPKKSKPFWPGLFAKCLESCNIKDLISNVGSGVGSGPAAGAAAAGGAAAPAAEEKKEEKKEEPEEESDDDMGFGLFDSIRPFDHMLLSVNQVLKKLHSCPQ